MRSADPAWNRAKPMAMVASQTWALMVASQTWALMVASQTWALMVAVNSKVTRDRPVGSWMDP
jgi:hypothetical protein